MRLRLWLVPLCACVAACADGETISPLPPPVIASLDQEGYGLRVDAAGGLVLSRDGAPLLTLPPGSLALGRVGAVSDDLSYDPFPLVVPNALYRAPTDLTFETPTSATVTSHDADHLVVSLAYPDRTATLDVRAGALGRFDLLLTPSGEGIAFMKIGAHVDAKEGLYGLGESFDDVNQRGKVRAMQLELGSSTESPDNEAHVPIPMLLGTTGWGLFVDSAHAGVFEVATKQADLVEATFGTGVDSKKGLAFHLFAAHHPLDLTKHYYDLTGYPKLPGRFALGPLLWRNENMNQAQLEADLEAMRDLDIATSGVWIDHPNATGVNTFDYDPARFPAPDEMIAHAHDLGFRVALWHVPYLDEKDPATAALRAEATSVGAYPLVHGVKLNPWGTALDFTNPAAVTFWQDHLRAYTDHGIDGFKLDYGEDVVPGATEARNQWTFFDGSDERTMHGRYQLFYHATYADLLPASGGFLLCRHATIGSQTLGPILWPGDLDASFAAVGEPATDGSSSYVSVGGLPASVIGGLTLGPSGFPFYGSDTGGYRHAASDPELLIRWFEQTSLSTVMQVGNGASTVPWEVGDASLLALYRQYARLHLRLFPYEWTYAERLATDGRAITRPLGLAFPELGVHPSDEYMFGDDLLVAPVLARGQTSRDVIFPEGRWMDWWTGEIVAGGATRTVAAPLGVLPLYLRVGGVVPLLRPTIDSMAPTTAPSRVDSFATSPGVLYARAAPDAAGEATFTLYDGGSLTTSGGPTTTLRSKSGSELAQGVVFELPGTGQAPASVDIDGAPAPLLASVDALESATSGWVFTPDAGGTLWVRLGPGAHTATIASH